MHIGRTPERDGEHQHLFADAFRTSRDVRHAACTARAGSRAMPGRWSSPRKRPRRTVEDEPGAMPSVIEPELATLVDRSPSYGDWSYEIKFDGYRMLARVPLGCRSSFSPSALQRRSGRSTPLWMSCLAQSHPKTSPDSHFCCVLA